MILTSEFVFVPNHTFTHTSVPDVGVRLLQLNTTLPPATVAPPAVTCTWKLPDAPAARLTAGGITCDTHRLPAGARLKVSLTLPVLVSTVLVVITIVEFMFADFLPTVLGVIGAFGRIWKARTNDELHDYVQVHATGLAPILVFELAHEGNFKPTRPLRDSLKMSRAYVKQTLGF